MHLSFKAWAFCAIMVLAACPLQGQEHYRVVLEPRLRTELSARVTSTVEVLNKRMGGAFKRDDVLMTLDDHIYEFAYQKAKFEVERAQDVAQAQQRLYDDGVASSVELKEAQASLASAKAEFAIAEYDLQSCLLIAPYDGKVQELHVQEHERVEPGQRLMEILDDSTLVAKLLLPAKFLGSLSVGKRVKVFVPGIKTQVDAVVTHIAPAIDPSSSLVKVDSEIDNSDGKLRAGMIGTIDLTGKENNP